MSTIHPYTLIEHSGIQYTTCRDYSHISRYRGLRQVIHGPDSHYRFIALETYNPFQSDVEVTYHDVASHEVNRLDLLAYTYLGSASYSWVIAQFNHIEDGFTIQEGQRLAIPKNLFSLMNKGEMLAPVSATALNLGEE